MDKRLTEGVLVRRMKEYCDAIVRHGGEIFLAQFVKWVYTTSTKGGGVMATIKTTYVIQSCPRCNKQLLKVAAGSTLIGSPLITCKGCSHTYKTSLREEWYAYGHKAVIFVVPILIPVAMFAVGALMFEPELGVMAAIFGLILALCFLMKDIIRIIMSVRRMRNAAYLDKLLEYGAIAQKDYDEFKQRAA